MNRILIMGRLTKDPELKAVGGGIEVANFTVAVDRRAGKEERETDFFECNAWRQSAAFVQKYFHKGDGILVEGKMQSRKVEKDGKKSTYWSLNVDNIFFPLGNKRTDSGVTEDVAVPF